MHDKITIFWFRQDLRISDNPGLFAASKNGLVMPIYIFDEAGAGDFRIGSASKCWLHHSLNQLNLSLQNNLNVYIGDSKTILLEIIQQYNIGSVYWNRCYEPWRIKDDTAIKEILKSKGFDAKSFNSALLWEPWEISKSDGTFYKVFTPFYQKGCLGAPHPREPLPEPAAISLVKDQNNTNIIDTLELLPDKPWHKGMLTNWDIGEKAAQQKLAKFLQHGLYGYKEYRNYPDKDNVSRLSPYLHFGEISPHQIWHAAQMQDIQKQFTADLQHFLSELGWREFSYYLLYHFPELPHKNFQTKFDQFPWQHNERFLKAWQTGQTGYPIVDAGMRELWQTGYMHNRVRMLVGSFLVKNLLLDWRCGAAWFADCLLDADLANNSASWQWVAGSGADAAPYFRIFNPVLQGEKFDPEGNYTRRYVPELSKLPDKFLFSPWEADTDTLHNAGVTLGHTYPTPIIDLKTTREQALRLYQNTSIT